MNQPRKIPIPKFYTYLYRDPKDGTPIYVGKGKDARALCHFGLKTRLSNVLRKRKKEGYVCVPIINYEVDEATALEMEKFWIDFYGRADLGKGTLFNLTDGGEGQSGAKVSDATKQKLSEAGLRRIQSEASRTKMSASMQGKNVGKVRSAETKAKLSAASARRGQPSYMRGKPMSEEAKAKQKATWARKRAERECNQKK